MAYATSVQNENSVRNTGFKIEAGILGTPLMDIGVASKMSLKKDHKVIFSEGDNAPIYNVRTTGRGMLFKVTHTELDYPKLALLEGGITTIEQVAQGATMSYTQKATLGQFNSVMIERPNINGYVVGSLKVTYKTPSGTVVTATRDTDYVALVASGYTYIARSLNSTIPLGTEITITYGIAMVKHIKALYGKLSKIKDFTMKLTNINDEGKLLVYDLFKVIPNKPEEIAISGQEAKDPWTLQQEFMAIPDPSHDMNVCQIIDEQGVI